VGRNIHCGCAAALLFLVGALAPVAAENIDPFIMPSTRLNALGGTHAALTDDFTSLFTNPAGFAGVKEELSAAELTVSVYGPVFDIADTMIEYLGSSGTLDISGIVGPGGFASGLDIGGPLSFGWVGRGLGFGFFNRSVADAGVTGTNIQTTAEEELLITGGYAFRIAQRGGHIVDAGFLGKGFIRGSLVLDASIFTVTDLFEDPLGGQPFTSAAGVGVDLGVRYESAKTFAAALLFRDAYSPALVSTYASALDFFSGAEAIGSGSYATVEPGLSVGLAYYPRFAVLERYFSRTTMLLDYRDILDLFALIPRNPILNIGLGMEVVVLDALSLRAGIADALPSLGFGIDFTFMQLDFAMRGIELGLEPGMRSTYALDLGLLFRY
jgi:hypothetical protein